MQTPQLLTDIANVMMLLAPSAALLCLVLAGISLRRDTGGVNFAIGGGFTKWMFWAVIFVTLPGLLIWFSNSGVSVPSATRMRRAGVAMPISALAAMAPAGVRTSPAGPIPDRASRAGEASAPAVTMTREAAMVDARPSRVTSTPVTRTPAWAAK